MDGDNFYLTLPSDASLLRYNENHGGRYTVDLPHQLNVSAHSWEVGLSEIIFTQDWAPLLESDIWAAVCIDVGEGKWASCGASHIGKDKAKKHYTDFMTCWDDALSPMITKALELSTIWPTTPVVSLTQSKRSKLVKFEITVVNTKRKAVKLEMSDALLKIMGFTRDQLEDGRAFLSNASQRIVAGPSRFQPSLLRGITSLWVYTNIVKPQITGHTFNPLLRVVEVDSSEGTGKNAMGTRVVSFNKPNYFGLNTNTIESISIWITNIGGLEPIIFATPVVCKLQFRRKKPWHV